VDVVLDESEQTGEWWREGVHQVSDGVYRVPLPLPSDALRAVNVYLLVEADGIVVIDSGWADEDSRALLVRALKALDATPSSIDRFLVTHMHRDHLEQAIAVRRDFGSSIALGRREQDSIDVSRAMTHRPFTAQVPLLRELGASTVAEELLELASTYPKQPPLEYPDDWLEAGDLSILGGRVLTAVPTPGHTRGHFVFHDGAARLLFAGDHVLPAITPSIGFESPLSDSPLGDFLDSLALVRSRPDARLLPAHGPVAPSVHARIDELVDHHATRLDLCVKAVAEGCVTGLDVANYLRWTRRNRKLAELDTFNCMLAIGETGAHLTVLEAQGRVRHTLVDGVRAYTLA
jgi:glyoxylase-like metal-dependent hydrolase (beta-lactamase superfamily II)